MITIDDIATAIAQLDTQIHKVRVIMSAQDESLDSARLKKFRLDKLQELTFSKNELVDDYYHFSHFERQTAGVAPGPGSCSIRAGSVMLQNQAQTGGPPHLQPGLH